MADDKPEDAGLAPDTGRAKRTPPTIDLEATEVSTQPQDVAGEPEAEPAAAERVHIRPEIAVLPAYKQGRQAAADAFKLSTNENPFPPLPGVVASPSSVG